MIAQAARESNATLERQFVKELADNNEHWRIKFDMLHDQVLDLAELLPVGVAQRAADHR